MFGQNVVAHKMQNIELCYWLSTHHSFVRWLLNWFSFFFFYFARNWTKAFCLFALLGGIVVCACACQCLCNMASLFTYCVFFADCFFFFHLCFVCLCFSFFFFFCFLTFALYFLNKEVVSVPVPCVWVCCIDSLLKMNKIEHSRNSRSPHGQEVFLFVTIRTEQLCLVWIYIVYFVNFLTYKFIPWWFTFRNFTYIHILIY